MYGILLFWDLGLVSWGQWVFRAGSPTEPVGLQPSCRRGPFYLTRVSVAQVCCLQAALMGFICLAGTNQWSLLIEWYSILRKHHCAPVHSLDEGHWAVPCVLQF